MVKLVSAFGLLSVLAIAAGSPVKRQDTTAATSSAVDTAAATTAAESAASTASDSAASTASDSAVSSAESTASESAASSAESAASSTEAGAGTGTASAAETTITAFIPSPGGPPNATFYAVTGANETYLAGVEYVPVTDSAGATSTGPYYGIYVLEEDEVTHIVLDSDENPIAITECDVQEGGTSAICDGLVVDTAAQGIAVFENLTISGQSTGIPVYLATGTADASGVSFASNAPGLVSSVQAEGGVSDTEIIAGTQTITSQASTSPAGLPYATGGSPDGSIASSGASGADTAATATIDSAASSTDTAGASTDTAASSGASNTDTAGSSTDPAASSTETGAATTGTQVVPTTA